MTNQEFKTKLKTIASRLHLFLTLILLYLVLSNHITIASDAEVRVVDIDLGFYKTQFLQSINK